jgi:hypothetical protein
MNYEEIPDWFWNLIDSSKPDLKKLEKALEELEKEQLEDYYGLYKRASQEIRDPWDGPYINEEIDHLSEDSTEDLCDWIVSQGYDHWSEMDIDDESLAAVFHSMKKVEKGKKVKGCVNWNSNTKYPYKTPKALALSVYEEKFGEDMYDHIDNIMDRVSPP